MQPKRAGPVAVSSPARPIATSPKPCSACCQVGIGSMTVEHQSARYERGLVLGEGPGVPCLELLLQALKRTVVAGKVIEVVHASTSFEKTDARVGL